MKKLIAGLREFETDYFPVRQELFAQLAHGQHPRVLFITCSDSRIAPHLLTHTDVPPQSQLVEGGSDAPVSKFAKTTAPSVSCDLPGYHPPELPSMNSRPPLQPALSAQSGSSSPENLSESLSESHAVQSPDRSSEKRSSQRSAEPVDRRYHGTTTR